MIKSLIIKKTKSNLLQNKSTGKTSNLKDAGSVLLLFENSDFNQVMELAATLEGEGKSCRYVVYSDVPRKNIPLIKGIFFTKRDLTFLGFPKSQIIQYFLQEADRTDILIDLSMHNYLPLSYLISLSKVKLKVGIKKEGFDLFNFMVDVPKNMDFKFLSEQIMFYLRKLKS